MRRIVIDSDKLDDSIHLFKNNLTMVQGATQLLKDRWDELAAQDRVILLKDLEYSVHQLTRQISSLRTDLMSSSANELE